MKPLNFFTGGEWLTISFFALSLRIPMDNHCPVTRVPPRYVLTSGHKIIGELHKIVKSKSQMQLLIFIVAYTLLFFWFFTRETLIHCSITLLWARCLELDLPRLVIKDRLPCLFGWGERAFELNLRAFACCVVHREFSSLGEFRQLDDCPGFWKWCMTIKYGDYHSVIHGQGVIIIS